MSQPGGPNVEPVKNPRYAFIIIMTAFLLATAVALSLLGVAFLVARGTIDIDRAKEILLVVIPVETLVIGGLFGFIAGRKS